jgi:hypothetical protein
METLVYSILAMGMVGFTVWYVGNVGKKDEKE